METTMTVADASRILRVDRLTVYRWAAKGAIPNVTRDEDGTRHFPVESVLHALKNHAPHKRMKRAA
jgi:excisionase family DNA binding protein